MGEQPISPASFGVADRALLGDVDECAGDRRGEQPDRFARAGEQAILSPGPALAGALRCPAVRSATLLNGSQ